VMSKLLLDTHILIWSLTKSDELSSEVKEAIKLAKANKNLYLVSPSKLSTPELTRVFMS